MKEFVCSSPNGSITECFYRKTDGHLHVLLERHLGPCECSFCRDLAPVGLKLRGPGWRMLHWPTPWSRWYLRWIRLRPHPRPK